MNLRHKKNVILGVTFLFLITSVVVITHLNTLKKEAALNDDQSNYKVDMSNVRYEMKEHIYNGEDYTVIQRNKYTEEKKNIDLSILLYKLECNQPPHASIPIFLVNKDETTLVKGYKTSTGAYVIEYYEDIPDKIPQYLSAFETKK